MLADDPEDAGVEDRADRRVAAHQRDERRGGHVDEGRGRPAEEHERGDREDEAERDAVRVSVLDRDREAFRQRRGDEERGNAGERRPRPWVAEERDRRRDIRRDPDYGDRRDDREQSRGG